MFCESISKIFNFSRTAENKKQQLCKATTLTFLHGSIAHRSNFMSDCKQMQVRLKKKKVHQPETEEIAGKQVAK